MSTRACERESVNPKQKALGVLRFIFRPTARRLVVSPPSSLCPFGVFGCISNLLCALSVSLQHPIQKEVPQIVGPKGGPQKKMDTGFSYGRGSDLRSRRLFVQRRLLLRHQLLSSVKLGSFRHGWLGCFLGEPFFGFNETSRGKPLFWRGPPLTQTHHTSPVSACQSRYKAALWGFGKPSKPAKTRQGNKTEKSEQLLGIRYSAEGQASLITAQPFLCHMLLENASRGTGGQCAANVEM